MATNNVKKLTSLKSSIEGAKSNLSHAEGRRHQLMQNLLRNHNCTSTKQGQKKLKDLKARISKITEELDNGIQEVAEKYKI